MLRRLRRLGRPTPRVRPASLVRATIVAAIALGVLLALAAPDVLAATPSPSQFAADLRSSGQGAGAAGAPQAAIWATLAVIGLGVATAIVTLLAVRFTGGATAGVSRDRDRGR